jgi:signal transduction histidine kinase/DNA-binding response OmpR family regulator/ligand-binding sensor domain-containing protein
MLLSVYLYPSGGGSSYSPQYSNPFTEPWRWQSFSELTGKGCRCMLEDKNKSLWFGINGGVMRYDGINWEFFALPKDFVDIPVVSLCFASDGSLYVGTYKGIKKLRQGKWISIPLNVDLGDPLEHPYNKIPIIESVDHSIWIGSHQGAIRIKDNNITLYRDNSVYQDPNKFGELRKQPLFDIYSIFEDKSGKMWFGLIDGRIFQCQFSNTNIAYNPQWRKVDTESGYVRTKYPLIKITSSGNVFIVSGQNDGGVNIKEGQRWKLFKSKNLFGIDDLYSDVIELKDGSICVGGVGRIFIYKSGSWKMYESTTLPFASNRLILFETADRNLFIIGLGNEVCRIDLSNQRWATIRGLNFQTEDKNGDKWFISVDGCIVRSDSKMERWTKYSKNDGVIDVPVVVFVSRNGNIWVAGSDNQIAATACFDGKKWTKQIHPKLGWGIDRRAIFEALDGSLWLGSASDILSEKGQLGGLVKYTNVDNPDNIKFEYHYADDNFRLTGIYGIGQTADGTVWTGQLGFYSLTPKSESWKRILEPSGLNASFIDCIQSSPTGDLWVGTRTNGVYFLNSKTGKWNRYTINDGLSSNTIVNIFVNSNQDVWVATNRDISHFDGRNWTRNSFHSFLKPKMDGISIRSSKDGGLWVNQNSPAWYRKALYKDSFLGGSFDEFITTRYYPDKVPPKTIITFSQDKIAQPGNVILSWTANDPWKLTPVEQIQYSYRIDDNEWSPFTYKTSDIFLSLPSGSHTFEVKARDRDMNVDPSPAKISFYVQHPVWAQAWFILMIFAFLSIIAFFIMHLYRRNKIIEEMSETKVRLFANISHELRTPLTLIMGPLLKVLESPLLEAELKKSLTQVNKNCHRLLRLINQVLDFRKLEAGQLKFEPKRDDIIDFLKEEVSVFEESAKSKNIYLNLETDISKLETWFDPDKIEKIMFNLLSNALKFTPHNGSITVHISRIEATKIRTLDLGLRKPVKFSNWLEIIINDSGIGIAERNLDKVFDQFYQVKDNLKAAVGGTGIGLSVAKEMVKIHGGKISVESSEGVGTSFIVKIPIIEEEIFEHSNDPEFNKKSDFIKLKFPENEGDESQAIIESENPPESNRSKILIVEDNAEMRQYIREELEKDYDVMESVNGEDGLNRAMNFNPDLILSDIMMPQMDGIEFCKRIKTDERTSHIAVILLTARASQEYKMEGLETGADDYLIKPFYNAELLVKIHNILETRKKLREKFGKSLQFEPNNIDITSVDQKFLKRAIDIIEEHLDDADFSVETFSKLVGMSRVSLYNKLNSLTNHSVQKFIFAIRLKRAAQLLKESGMTVTEVAYSVGFKDPSHFSKLFKKQFGVSPKAYINDSSRSNESILDS